MGGNIGNLYCVALIGNAAETELKSGPIEKRVKGFDVKRVVRETGDQNTSPAFEVVFVCLSLFRAERYLEFGDSGGI